MNHYINGRISTFIVWKTQCWKNVSFPQINLQNQFHFQLKILHAVFTLNYFVGLAYVWRGGCWACICVCTYVPITLHFYVVCSMKGSHISQVSIVPLPYMHV